MITTNEIHDLIKDKDYMAVREAVSKWNDADVAELIENLPKLEALVVFRLLPKDMAADVFAFFTPETQQKIITSLSDKDAGVIINNLCADEAADLMEEMPSNVAKRILAAADKDTIASVNKLLEYPKESAGSLMTVEYVSLKEKWTAEKTIEYFRQNDMTNKQMDYCYVLSEKRGLVGIVSLKEIIVSPPSTKLMDIMAVNPVAVHTLDDQEEVAKQFSKYDFSVLPVVDSEEHMLGIITVDDIIDVMEQEATEDMHKMAAVLPGNKPYMKSSIWDQIKKRIPWLLLLMLSATFTGMIITSFEAKLAQCITLTAYIPMLMDSGGNAGGQASTTIIRAISLGEIRFKDTFRVIWKEIRIALVCGIVLAVVNFVKMLILDQVPIIVSIVVCLTLIFTVLCAKLIGCILPILAKRIKLDPAVMANPIITTIVDAVSLLLYFGFASFLLGL